MRLADIERLIELQAIYDLKGRRDHAVDRKDWDTYAGVFAEDCTVDLRGEGVPRLPFIDERLNF